MLDRLKWRTARTIAFCLSAPLALTTPAFAQDVPASLEHDQPKFNHAAAEYDAGNYAEAYSEFLELADDNDIAAMRNVALMKRKGLGTAKDPEGAREYLERAADGGLPTAQYDLAEMMLNGEGGAVDPKGALPWLKSAVTAHHPLAEFRLGEMFEAGQIVPQDLTEARILYADAAARGVAAAGSRLSALQAAKARADQAQQAPSP